MIKVYFRKSLRGRKTSGKKIKDPAGITRFV